MRTKPVALATILIEQPPEIEIKEGIVYFTDNCGVRRAMRKSVAIQTFARLADRLRSDRGLGAEIIQFPTAETA